MSEAIRWFNSGGGPGGNPMVYEDENTDSYRLSVAMDAELAKRLEEVAENQPELTESQLCRTGLRLALENYE